MAKFKAGDFITGEVEYEETQTVTDEYGDDYEELVKWTETKVYLVNRVIVEDRERSFFKGKEFYSLDNGDGFIDARMLCSQIDGDFRLCE